MICQALPPPKHKLMSRKYINKISTDAKGAEINMYMHTDDKTHFLHKVILVTIYKVCGCLLLKFDREELLNKHSILK